LFKSFESSQRYDEFFEKLKGFFLVSVLCNMNFRARSKFQAYTGPQGKDGILA
jgi:hypothetical protein